MLFGKFRSYGKLQRYKYNISLNYNDITYQVALLSDHFKTERGSCRFQAFIVQIELHIKVFICISSFLVENFSLKKNLS